MHANAGLLSVGPVSSLLPHGACGCSGDRQWPRLLCGSDLPEETESCQGNANVPGACYTPHVSFQLQEKNNYDYLIIDYLL